MRETETRENTTRTRTLTNYLEINNTNHHLHILCQDLQDEVEKHRDMYLSLDSAGKKLVSGLDTQEDATLLHRRLEEMNQRWSYLKAKSIAIR